MGAWKATILIIGVNVAERLVCTGIIGNLVTYFTLILSQDIATSVTNVNIWTGVASILPFFGAFVADSCLGLYKTLLGCFMAYIMGLVLMTISATLSFSSFNVCLFFIGIYLVAVGQGSFTTCLLAFGADQFDDESLEAKNNKKKSSFFNWCYFGTCLGGLVGFSVILYVEEYVGWNVGFGILAAFMALALLLFLYGTPTYVHKPPGGSPITNIVHVLVATYHKWNIQTAHSTLSTTPSQEPLLKQRHGIRLRFLDKATIADELDDAFQSANNWRICTVEQVNEVKNVLTLLPIWVSLLAFGIVFVLPGTFFTKQGNTMTGKIGWFEIPAATMQSSVLLVVSVIIPLYDKIFVPLASKITGNERGITILQRIGIGLVISAIAMLVSALIEIKRINTAMEHGLVDLPEETIPLSILWLLPQYILLGISYVFTLVGMQEFFYEEIPDAMKSLGVAISSSVTGTGSILSGVLILIIQNLSCKYSSGWFPNNLNKGHLDYFYWFLAALCVLSFCLFVTLTNSYEYRKKRELVVSHQALQP